LRLRRTLTALIGLLAADLLAVLITGSRSLLPTATPVGPKGFVIRTVLLGCLILFRVGLEQRPSPLAWGRLVLLLLLLPTLVQFQLAGGRINGDGVMYYVYVRSLLKDHDLDFTNEYTHYGLITRGDLSVPTKTGLRRSIFSIGPAVVWTPFFIVGEAAARVEALLGGSPDLSGYGPHHRNAVALGSLLLGFLALLLIHSLLARHFLPSTALGATLLVWGASFLPWYMVEQPTMSHAPSTFASALALWLWDRQREERSPAGFLILGLASGLSMCIRWQNGIFLILPGLEILGRLRRDPVQLPRLLSGILFLLGGTLVGALPQMLAWKALFDTWILTYPPHGTEFVRLGHPFLLQMFFSSRHGLFSWTPVLWGGYLGFLPLLRRRAVLARWLLVPLILMTYVNACSGDWWAGGSFSNRRFDSLLPLLAFGLAASIDVGRAFLQKHPEAVLPVVALPFVVWNALLMDEVRRGLVPRDNTVAFHQMVAHGGEILAQDVGSPETWPASWLFAWRYSRPPGQYDLLVGRYLFYRQNNMGGHIDIGDEAMFGEGWGPVSSYAGTPARRILGRARLFAPLDVAEGLDLLVDATAAKEGEEVVVEVNGQGAGRLGPGSGWGTDRLRIPKAFWRRELNEVVLKTRSKVWIARIDFAQVKGDR